MRALGLAKLGRGLLGIAIAGLPILYGGGCSSDEKPAYRSTPTTGGTGGRGGTGGIDASSGRDAMTDTGTNCKGIVCRGHSKCIPDGGARCVCDQGYVLDRTSDTCVVDESCIKIRFLDDSCRQVANGPSGVGLFFAVDYCAGTAVLPARLGRPDDVFQVLESRIGDAGTESTFWFVPRDVENYLTIAIDLSTSLTDKPGLLSAMVKEMRAFVQKLRPEPGEPPVGISVLVFARFVREYVAPTTNLAAVDTALAQIESDPLSIQATVNGAGTALFEATKKAIRSTERMQRLRSLVTDAGVLTTGVAVIVSDGQESANGTFDKTLNDQTLVNVISVGIGGINDPDLTAIGRDGSFLTPTIPDVTQAFNEIAQRVDEAPQRAYLLAYCSTATTGTPTVTVTFRQPGALPPPKTTASCTFNAELFSIDPLAVCDRAFFDAQCDQSTGRRCGGLIGCGACADGECCGGDGQCRAPGASALDCRNQDDLCELAHEVCVRVGTSTEYSCEPPFSPSADAGACGTSAKCEPGRFYCEASTGKCLPVLKNGDNCENATGAPRLERCPELNCSRENPENPTVAHTCRPRAKMYEPCGGTGISAVCERGASCRASLCQPRKPLSSFCSADNECRSGQCAPGKVCINTNECFFSWGEKMRQ